jgi:hypothetical protein
MQPPSVIVEVADVIEEEPSRPHSPAELMQPPAIFEGVKEAEELRFRPNVVAIVINKEGKVCYADHSVAHRI